VQHQPQQVGLEQAQNGDAVAGLAPERLERALGHLLGLVVVVDLIR
jgi:hypothetical protein